MPIYADKKNGKPTGRWRVEVQKGGQRYRQRHDDYKDAQADEARVIALFASSCAPVVDIKGVTKRVEVGPKDTLADVIKAAKGTLWRNAASEDTAWRRMDHIGQIIGFDTRMDDVDTLMVDRLIKVLRSGREGKAGVSDATINRYLSHFHKILGWAKDRGLRSKPVADVSFDWQEESEGRIRWITPEEEERLEALLPRNVWETVHVAIESGCRRGELLSVEPGQLNRNKLHLWETKTDTPRTIPLEPEVMATLKRLVDTETLPTEAELRHHWNVAREAMGLAEDPNFVFHACRHTCATRLVEAGVNLRIIQRFLGHKSIQTTMRYSHVHDTMLEDAVVQRRQHRTQIHLRSEPPAPTGHRVGQSGLRAA